MVSRHREPGLTVRPPADLKARASTALSDRGKEMQAFITACLRALDADPDGFLAVLTEHWPAPKPRGRPRKSPPQDSNSPQ